MDAERTEVSREREHDFGGICRRGDKRGGIGDWEGMNGNRAHPRGFVYHDHTFN